MRKHRDTCIAELRLIAVQHEVVDDLGNKAKPQSFMSALRLLTSYREGNIFAAYYRNGVLIATTSDLSEKDS